MLAFPYFVSLRDAWHSPSLTLERLQKPAPIFRTRGGNLQRRKAKVPLGQSSAPSKQPCQRRRSALWNGRVLETNKLWPRCFPEASSSLIQGSSRVCAFSHIGGLSTYCRAHQPEAFLRLEEPMQAALGYMWAVAQNGLWRSCQSGKRRKATIMSKRPIRIPLLPI